MDKNLLNWDSGELLTSPLHFIFCFITTIFWLGRDCFACLFPLLPPKYVLLEGKVCAILCPGTWHPIAACYTNIYWQKTRGCGQYVQKFLWKPEEYCCPCHMVERTQQTHFQPARQTSQSLRHISVPQRWKLEQHTLSLNTHTMD